MRIQPNVVPSPPAGEDWVFTHDWSLPPALIISVTAELRATATVASRQPCLQLLDPSGIQFWKIQQTNIQPASASYFWTWSATSFTGGAAFQSVSIPDNLYIPPGWTIGPNTVALQSGDQWVNIAVLLKLSDKEIFEIDLLD